MALRGTVLDPSICRDYKGKWPLLTVETGAKWGLKENLEGVLPCLVRLACPACTVKKRKGFALCPRDLMIPVSKFIFRTVEK